jgi:hypothetical protein
VATHPIVDLLKKTLPKPMFRVADITKMTGGVLNALTVRNQRSRGEWPDDLFIYNAENRLCALTEPFIDAYEARLAARRPHVVPSPGTRKRKLTNADLLLERD